MMDGFSHALGILYAENFDDVPAPAPPPQTRPKAPPSPVSTPPVPAPPSISEDDLEQACRMAVEQAEADWSATAARRQQETLSALGTGLADLRETAARHAEATAEAIARTALAVVAGALPQLCRHHGDQEVRALLRTLLPLLCQGATITVRVHPSLIDTLRDDLGRLDETIAVELRPANLPPGDVRLAWTDGSLVRDTAAIRAAIEDGLTQLGLLPSPDRSSAHDQPVPTIAPLPAAAHAHA